MHRRPTWGSSSSAAAGETRFAASHQIYVARPATTPLRHYATTPLNTTPLRHYAMQATMQATMQDTLTTGARYNNKQ